MGAYIKYWTIRTPPENILEEEMRLVRRIYDTSPTYRGEVVVVPAEKLTEATDRIAELEAEIVRLRREYMVGHRDGYREGSTSSLADSSK